MTPHTTLTPLSQSNEQVPIHTNISRVPLFPLSDAHLEMPAADAVCRNAAHYTRMSRQSVAAMLDWILLSCVVGIVGN